MPQVVVEVKHGDALALDVDVLTLKYAQDFFGLEAIVSTQFANDQRAFPQPLPWDFVLEGSPAGVGARRVLIVGVPTLERFRYREIRIFARRALTAITVNAPATRHLALTLHGAGYGLDEEEALEALVAGLADGVQSGDTPRSLRLITIIENNALRASRLRELLLTLVPNGGLNGTASDSASESAERLRAAGYASEAKPHVFVAMPFDDAMDDVYHFGILKPVRAAGYVCERADLTTFVGDVVEHVRNRIKSAALVVADLSNANPNVFLEVGYAWGAGVPTILLVRDGQPVPFDARNQRILIYKKIRHLEELLETELDRLPRRT